jgi:sec-independent protein translocase protein TatA
MGLSWWHIMLVLLVFVLLFGTGKISGLMGDLAKGIKSFKKEMSEAEVEPEAEAGPEPEARPAPKAIEHQVAPKPAPRKTKSAAGAKASRTRKSS